MGQVDPVARHAVAWKWPVDKLHPARSGKLMWCFTRGNARPDPSATRDRTYCGHVVIMRMGSGKRVRPTCPECLAKWRARERRAGR